MKRKMMWEVSVAVMAAMALAGCTMSSPTVAAGAASPKAGSGSTTAQTGKLKVGIASREITNDYNRDVIAGASALFKAQGGTVTVTNGGGDATKQINDIDTLINSGINVLFIGLGAPAQLAPEVAKAKARGIVVVTAGVGSTVAGTVGDYGGDENLMGEMMSRALLESMGYKGNLYAFWVPGAPLLETRLRILKSMLVDYPDVTLHLVPTDFSPATTQSKMQAVLTANPNKGSIAGVWGSYDQMISGAVQAISQAGRSEIKVAAIDGDRATFQMLYAKGSPFVATVVQNAQQIGQLAGQAAIDTRANKKVNHVFTTAWVATRNNGIAAAEERYGKSIWAELKLDPKVIAKQWPQTQKVSVLQPVSPQN